MDFPGKTGKRRNGEKSLFPFSEENYLWLLPVDALDKQSEDLLASLIH